MRQASGLVESCEHGIMPLLGLFGSELYPLPYMLRGFAGDGSLWNTGYASALRGNAHSVGSNPGFTHVRGSAG
jgi:hypothetical protein